jgi:hypothetical protein
MKRSVNAVLWTCNACGNEALSLSGVEDPPRGWFSGDVVRDGIGGEFAACRPACIKAAVLAAIEKEED